MDNYTEQIVKAKPGLVQYLMLFGSILLDVVGVFATLIFSGFGFLVLCGAGFLTYLSVRSLKFEYEYIFTNGDCDISKIINKESRKDVYELFANDVQRVLPYSSDKFQNEMKINNKLGIKKFTSNNIGNQKQWYVFITKRDEKETAIVLELLPENVEYIKLIYKLQAEF